jgi:NADPH:quinone reductase-like Zn-dependent oxidoreductase
VEIMKAVLLTGFGGVEKLELREVPSPRPGPGEVRVRVRATSINPVDWKIRSGAFRVPGMELPTILGRDVAGEVIEGGQRVMGFVSHSYAEELVAKATDLAPIPAGLDFAQAAALPLVTTTGAQLIEEAVRPSRGQLVLVTGALGGVGRTAVFVALQHGARVLAGVRRNQKEEASSLGAEGVVAIDDEAEIRSLPKLDAIADTVGGETIGRLLPALKEGGVLGSVLGEPEAAKGKKIQVRAMVAHTDARRLRELAEAAARGEFRIPVEKTMPLAQVREAQQMAERGGVGKIVLTP